ncbi:LysR substrate-binding domain-containing protein [Tamaricihabitans halophyticus]|nr:LysR substrate-binding domain-containing protein [Tamaricihabitans halophyticus]
MIDLARLRLLIALHELGTLHAAAASLHVSASAASQQLATLTREVGATLTEADGRKLRFTDAGKVLVEHAYQLLAQVERARGDVRAASGGELGELTVGSYSSLICSLLIPATDVLHGWHPRLRVNIREVTSPDSLAGLASGELDVVVDVEAQDTPTIDDPRYTRMPLGTEDIELALPADHPLASESTADLAAHAAADWVSTMDGDACDQLLRAACAAAGFNPIIRHRASDWRTVLALVAAGRGVALVPGVTPALVPAGVSLVPFDSPAARRHVYAAVRRGSEARPAVQACLSALGEQATAAAG